MLLFILILALKRWLILTNICLINFFKKLFCRIDNWINKGSGWIIESIDAEYVRISVFSQLSGCTYIELTCGLRNLMIGLINIENIDNKCFFWCRIRHWNPLKTHPERITKADKNMVDDLDYEGIDFPVSKKDFNKIEKKTNIWMMYFDMKLIWFILFMYRMKKFKIAWCYWW